MWPHGPAGSILITTVDPFFQSSNLAGQGQQLNELGEDAGVEMVIAELSEQARGRGNAEETRREAIELVRSVDNLPLAIKACIGFINDTSRTLAQYNRRYKSTEIVLKDDTSGHYVNSSHAPYSRGTGLSVVYSNHILTLNKESRELLNTMALLYPEEIPDQLFDPDSPVDNVDDISFTGQKLGPCISRLSKGLILLGPGNGTRTGNGLVNKDTTSYHMHRLLRKFIRQQLDDSSRQKCFEIGSRLLFLAADSKHRLNQEYYSDYFQHIESFREFYLETCKSHRDSILQVPICFVELLQRSGWLVKGAPLTPQGFLSQNAR